MDLREVEARIGELQTAVQARGLTYRADLDFALKRLSVEQLTAEYERVRALAQVVIDDLSIDTRKHRALIEALQTDIAELRRELETTTDEALKEEARLQISTLRGHQEDIQTIQAQGRAEIATLETEVRALVDPTLTEATRLQIAQLQTEIEVIQDRIATSRETQAQIKRALLDAGPDEQAGLKGAYLDRAVEIAGEQVALDEVQTLVASIRESFIDPALAGDLHARQELKAEIRGSNAQAAVFLQEIAEQIAEIRASQIDPARAEQVQALRAEIFEIAVGIDQLQDMMAANAVEIAQGQAVLRRLREDYREGLRDLQRVQSVAAIEAAYGVAVASLQADLGQARSSKNRIRVQLAEVRHEYQA